MPMRFIKLVICMYSAKHLIVSGEKEMRSIDRELLLI
jgi:hypothetical protein